MEVIDCAHGEIRGARYCALCRRAGVAARDEGTTRAAANNAEWVDQAVAAIRTLARSGAPFTAEDVVQVVGHPDGTPNAIGAVILKVARTGLIYRYGDRPADRASSHRRRLQVWRGSTVPADYDDQLALA